MGNQFFAIQNGGECWTTATAGDTYKKYGTCKCAADGTGGPFCQEVYKIGTPII